MKLSKCARERGYLSNILYKGTQKTLLFYEQGFWVSFLY